MKTSPLFRYFVTVGLFGLMISPLFGGNSILLNETFAAGQRLTQNLPTTSAWYGSSTPTDTTAGEVTFAKGAHLITYFTDMNGANNNPVTLSNIGDKLNITFSLSIDSSAASSFRIGLFDSTGLRANTDAHTVSNSIFEDYTGYAAFITTGATSTTGAFNQRDADKSSKLINGSDSYAALVTTTNNTGAKIDSGSTYTGTFSLERTSAGVVLTATINGLEITATDSTSPYTAFDTFAILGASTLNTVTLKNVMITYTAIPEPSTSALMIGAILLGFIACVRAQHFPTSKRQ